MIAKKNNQKLPRVPIINMSVQINGSNKFVHLPIILIIKPQNLMKCRSFKLQMKVIVFPN